MLTDKELKILQNNIDDKGLFRQIDKAIESEKRGVG